MYASIPLPAPGPWQGSGRISLRMEHVLVWFAKLRPPYIIFSPTESQSAAKSLQKKEIVSVLGPLLLDSRRDNAAVAKWWIDIFLTAKWHLMPLIKSLLIAKRPSSVDHRPGFQYYFKTSLKKVKYITKFTMQDICIVNSSCAHIPGNIEAFCHIVHYHYCRQGLETPCTVCFCLFPL